MQNELFSTQCPVAFIRRDDGNDDRMGKILFLQRLIRSFYVRRQFQQVQREYLKTLSDIEGELLPPVHEPVKILPSMNDTKSVAIVPSKEELLRKREEIAIELLWIEQAIKSRKDYLYLKSRYATCLN